jgi:hypothetical protein
MYNRMADIVPEISPSRISRAGASGLRNVFSGKELTLLLEAYMAGIKNVFLFAVAGAATSVLIALLIPLTRLPAPEAKTTNTERELANVSRE